MRSNFSIYFGSVAFLSVGCASPNVTFTSNEKATVSLVTTTSTDGQGEVLGDTPQTLPMEKLEGKVVKIWSPDVYPQFWVLSPLSGGDTSIQLKLEKKPASNNQSAASTNVKFRMIMRAYKALADQKWQMARDLSDELAKLEPEAAAPHLITGIAFLREGKKPEARSAFERAQAFDPDDADITKLIRIAQ